MATLFTIGHSTHEQPAFIELLKKHAVQAVADVRSSPYSQRLPQFNREILEQALRAKGIHYAFLGEELGARRTERECYQDGRARYELIAQTPRFASGLQRLQTGLQRYTIALLCAEKDPLECHRTILVCRQLREKAEIEHILSDGNLESQRDAENRLMSEERVPSEDFFVSPEALLAAAYDRRGAKIAYHECTEVETRV